MSPTTRSTPLEPLRPRPASSGASLSAPLLDMPRGVPTGARDARLTHRPLWDAGSGRFDPGRLRTAIVSRGWTVPDFAIASQVSRSCLYKALRGYAVGDRTVVRILEALDSRQATGLLDD